MNLINTAIKFVEACSDDRREEGFSLVEMLVVITIIAVLSTTTIMYFLRTMKSRGTQAAGSVFEAAFSRARQEAGTTRVPHYLVFCNNMKEEQGELMIVREDPQDGNESFDFNVSKKKPEDPSNSKDDLIKNGEFSFTERVFFVMENSVLGDSPPFWIKFGADSSIIDSSSGDSPPKKDQSWRYLKTKSTEKYWKNSDLQIIKLHSMPQSTGNNACSGDVSNYNNLMNDFVLVDWEAITGKVSGLYYAKEKE